jgi:hypothetical protein
MLAETGPNRAQNGLEVARNAMRMADYVLIFDRKHLWGKEMVKRSPLAISKPRCVKELRCYVAT